MHELPRDLNAAFLAAGEVERAPLAHLPEVEAREQLLAAPDPLGFRDPPQHSVDVEVPLDGREVERLALLDDADAAPDLLAVPGRVETQHAQCSGGRLEEGRHHLDQRRLPGAVPAEEAEHLPRPDGEADSVEREPLPVVGVPEVLGEDDRLGLRRGAAVGGELGHEP